MRDVLLSRECLGEDERGTGSGRLQRRPADPAEPTRVPRRRGNHSCLDVVLLPAPFVEECAVELLLSYCSLSSSPLPFPRGRGAV